MVSVTEAQVTENFVRLAEDRQNKRGSLWNVVVRLRPLLHRLAPCCQPVLLSLSVLLQPNMFANWEVTFSFRIHGVRRSLRRARVCPLMAVVWPARRSQTHAPDIELFIY